MSLRSKASPFIIGCAAFLVLGVAAANPPAHASCAAPECDPATEACCNPSTCKFLLCDPSVDPCCSATTCGFDQCNPEVEPCCDADTCAYKSAGAECLLDDGTNAGCRTGTCTASHACTGGTAADDLDDGTSCVRRTNKCHSGECSNGQCVAVDGAWADRCEDQNVCTNDAAACKINSVTAQFIRCAFKDPAIYVQNGTSCSEQSGAICTIKQCADGQCAPMSPPQTLNCGTVPSSKPCKLNSCRINAQTGLPECVPDQNKPAGTVCEASVPSDDWDCRHYRCSKLGRCRGKNASEYKPCDYQPSITPAHRCLLGECNKKGKCKSPDFVTASVVTDVETAALHPDGSPVRADLITCPSDLNNCTFDRCSGDSDACVYPCTVGVDCAVPDLCEGICELTSGGVCQCAEAP